MSTVQRHEVEAWVNPPAWEDPAQAEAVVEAILASGTTDEEAWVKIAGGAVSDQQAAAEREGDRAALAKSEAIMTKTNLTVAAVQTNAGDVVVSDGHTAYGMGSHFAGDDGVSIDRERFVADMASLARGEWDLDECGGGEVTLPEYAEICERADSRVIDVTTGLPA